MCFLEVVPMEELKILEHLHLLLKGRKKAENVTAWLVPGSHIVEDQIKEEGILDIIGRSRICIASTRLFCLFGDE